MKNNRKPCILNVDDNDAGRYTTTRLLRQAGFEVQEAATGREALRLAKECPDLILLDMKLPDISGGEVCRQIKANRRTAAIPVVHLSAAFVSDADRVLGLEQGADGYLTQPMDPKVLVATINSILRLKTVEQDLRESEERFRAALRNSPIIVSNQDRELRYTWIYNPQPGFKPETLLGKTDADLLAAEEAARLTEIKRRVLETGVPVRKEVRMAVGGQVFFYDLAVEPFHDAGGDIVGVSSVMVDVTERKQSEEELRSINAELERRVIERTCQLEMAKLQAEVKSLGNQDIIDTMREFFLVLDSDLRVLSANRSFYDFFKVIPEKTIGNNIYNLGNRQWDIPGLRMLLEEILPNNSQFDNYEVDHDFLNIGHRIMLLNARQITNKEIHPQIILLAIEDITERKRLYDELKESEECYRRAFETSRNVLLLVHKVEGDILHSNEAAQEFLGYSPEEFLKKKLWEIGMIKDEKDFQETVSLLNRDGVIHYQDTPLTTQQGLSIATDVFLIDRAKVIQCNIQDITKHKESEEALKESELRFKTIFNESMDGMLLVEIGIRRFSMCNPKICLMLGYSQEEMMRLGVDDIHPEGDLPLVVEKFEHQPKGGKKLSEGLPVKRKDGSLFYADINTSLITLSGKKYLMRSFRDITDSKKIQDELKEKMWDLERFSKFAVNRELKMEELEKKIEKLEEKPEAR